MRTVSSEKVERAAELGRGIIRMSVQRENQHFTPYLVTENLGIIVHAFNFRFTPVFMPADEVVLETACATICLQAAIDTMATNRLTTDGEYRDSSISLQLVDEQMVNAAEFIADLGETNPMLIGGIAKQLISEVPEQGVDELTFYTSAAINLVRAASQKIQDEIVHAQSQERPFFDPNAAI